MLRFRDIAGFFIANASFVHTSGWLCDVVVSVVRQLPHVFWLAR